MSVLFACTDDGPSADDDVGDGDGLGPNGPGCEDWQGFAAVANGARPEFQAVSARDEQSIAEVRFTTEAPLPPIVPAQQPTTRSGAPLDRSTFIETYAKPFAGGGWLFESDLWANEQQLDTIYEAYLASFESPATGEGGVHPAAAV
ncbi:MAG: hypothetical protein KC431_16890, partial [Myxococcales bacterium]|nr:hypothetical protein [Myxococcales bacterium]